MNQHKVRTTVGLIGVLVLLMSLLAVGPAMAQAISATLGQSYVSNTAVGGADNTVTITVTDAGRDLTPGAGNDAIAANQTVIKNLATGVSITLALAEDAVTPGKFAGTFAVVAPAPLAGEIKGGEGEKIQVTYTTAGGAGILALTPAGSTAVEVDAKGPTISNTSPAHNKADRIQGQLLQAELEDAKAGLGATTAAVQANVTFNVDGVDFTPVVTSLGSGKYRASVGVTLAEGAHTWQVTVKDILANATVSDAVTTTPVVADPFDLEIDLTAPALDLVTASVKARTGDTANAAATPVTLNTTADNRKSIRVGFTDGLLESSVQAADFRVLVGTTDIAVTGVNWYKDLAAHVFLTLGSELAADAKPVVRLVGDVSDDAGNSTATGEVTADDGIAPKLTTTVTGTGASRPVSNKLVTIKVEADEPSVNPTINTGLTVKPVGSNNVLGAAEAASKFTQITAGKAWEWEFTFSDTTTADMGLYNVEVAISDSPAGNGGSAGNADPTNKAAILFEQDANLSTPDFTPLTTTSDPNTFITVKFTGEAAEYGLDDDAPKTFLKVGDAGFGVAPTVVVTNFDTHAKVTVTAATLDGNAVTFVSSDNITWILGPQGLSLGDHTLKVTGKDTAGNSKEFTNTFKVTERAAFAVDLKPGWNLVSLAAEPADPAINSVIPASHPIDTVLAYDAATATWLVATRDTETGLLKGTLTTITSKWAVWVHTSNFQSLSVTLAPRDAQGVLPPTLKLKAGWNLVPVLSLAADPAAGTGIVATTYLAGTGAIRVYGYNTETSAFALVKLDGLDSMVTGRGYLVYVPKDVDLVP